MVAQLLSAYSWWSGTLQFHIIALSLYECLSGCPRELVRLSAKALVRQICSFRRTLRLPTPMLRHASRRAAYRVACLARLAQRPPCAAALLPHPRRASHLGGVARSASEVGEAMTWPERDTWCGVLREADVGRSVTLCGWVDKQRNMGAVVFADLRDQSGFVQARRRSQRLGGLRPMHSHAQAVFVCWVVLS